jgi:hypothetical protein
MAGRAGLTVVRTRFSDPVPNHERLGGDDADTAQLNEFLYGPQNYVLVAEKPLLVEAPDAQAPAAERPAPAPIQPVDPAAPVETAAPVKPVAPLPAADPGEETEAERDPAEVPVFVVEVEGPAPVGS